MSSILFSRDWHRLSELKPSLRSHVEVHVHNYRGKRWYLLQNHSTGHFKRLTPEAYLLVGLMNGYRTVEEIWQAASERLQERLPTHEEVLQLLGNLYQANIIKMDLTGDASELFRKGEEQRSKRFLGKLRSPLSVQIPLFDPNKFLDKTERWVAPLFSRWFTVLWLVMVATLAVLGWKHWHAFTENMADRVLAADNLVLLWLIYPLIKILHELGHAYVIKRSGGEVHEVGVMFLVFFPMPYVDASASSSFSSKYRRMFVDGAGMMVELFIAAIAMLVWVNAEEGLARSFAFNIIFIAGVSTILFNGNPLLRFDGYYLLADWLELPNLSQRANQYWAYLCKRYLFAVDANESPADSRHEAVIFTLYGGLSFFYRLLISISIVLFVANKFFFVGVILGVWSVAMVWVWPFIKLLWQTFNSPEITSGARSPWWVVGLVAVLIYVLLFVLPLPRTTTVQGVVLANTDSRLVTQENCRVNRWLVDHGSVVEVEQPILQCKNEAIETELKAAIAELAEVKARRMAARADPVQLKVLDEEVALFNGRVAVAQKRIQGLQIRADAAGTVYLPQLQNLEDRWLKRGEVIGYIKAKEGFHIKAMLPDYQVNLVRSDTQQVTIRTGYSAQESTVTDWRLFPASSREIISPIMLTSAGGEIVPDPSDPNKAVGNYFIVQLKVKDPEFNKVNQRVYVQFTHSSEAIGFRIYELVRRTFLEYFNV